MSERRRVSARQQFGRQATHYARSRGHASGEALRVLVDWAQPRPTDRVLDVATGAGFTALAFAPHVASVVAYDPTPEMLREAVRLSQQRGLTNLRFVQGVAEQLPFLTGIFDLFACRAAPHHFSSVPQFLAEARRVLRPGGNVLISDPIAPEDTEVDRWQNHVELLRDPSHVRDYTLSEWLRFFKEAGLAVRRTSTAESTDLSFDDWVERSGTSPENVHELRRLFRSVPPAVAQELRIVPRGQDFEFAWTNLVALAVKE